MGLDQWVRVIDDEGDVEEITYRKFNWFRNWVINNTILTHESDCEEVIISKDKLQELLDVCEDVLKDKNPKVAEELLPVLGGFFFGTYDYDEWYYESVQIVRDDVKRILNKGNSVIEVIYEDWW